jgi:hypothetical protein
MLGIIEAVFVLAFLFILRRLWKEDVAMQWKVLMTIVGTFMVVSTIVGWCL